MTKNIHNDEKIFRVIKSEKHIDKSFAKMHTIIIKYFKCTESS